MAGPVDFISNRDLWHTITGSSLTKPKKLVEETIQKNKKRLKDGLSYYSKASSSSGGKRSIHGQLTGTLLEFVRRLSRFLNLDFRQSQDLFSIYTEQEYKGRNEDLPVTLNIERHVQVMLSKIRDFYYNERLYTLRIIKHVLSFWQEQRHPYMAQYAGFVKDLYASSDFAKNVLKQYDTLCEEEPPGADLQGKVMNERHVQSWVVQNLREQCELLELLILYYRSEAHSPKDLLECATKFKKQGFGWRQTHRHLFDGPSQPLLQRIGFLQVLLLLEGIDLESLFDKCRNDKAGDHHMVCDPSFKSLDVLLGSLGDLAEHGPLTLAWAAIRQLAVDGEEASAATRRLGNKALELGVFGYLARRLRVEPCVGNTILAQVCHSVVYGLLRCVLTAFHQDTLGDNTGLYEVVSILLKQSSLSEDFWAQGLSEGLGTVVTSSYAFFPCDLIPLCDLCASLASANQQSARQVAKTLQNLSVYTELMDRSTQLNVTRQQHVWQLAANRAPYPYNGCELIIPRGVRGEILPQVEGASVIQWDVTFSAWDVCVGEVLTLLDQISHGAGMVQTDAVRRVTAVCSLVEAVMTSSPDWTREHVPQTATLTTLLYQVLSRFCQVTPPPVDLLASALQVLATVAQDEPVQTWRQLQQTGLLPYLTENIDSFAEISSGSGLCSGAYGNILAGTECTVGEYPLTTTILGLLASLVQPLYEAGEADQLMAAILFVTREVFPCFSKLRYNKISKREQIGQKCLEIFHKVLNVMGHETASDKKRVTVRDVCVYSLLYSECGQALLDIVSTSVEVVDSALASQGSATEGAGTELIHLIRMAFSVLNRLLLLRPDTGTPSPVEQSLAAHHGNRSQRHLLATVAQYIYHKHDPRLATLATVLLRRLAMMFPMSILACLGDEADAMRDAYLARLQAPSEDVRLKVVILEFLATCVDTQPGLIEIFLNVRSFSKTGSTASTTKAPERSSVAAGKAKDQLKMGAVSCLQTVMALIQDKKQGTYECPSQLLCAAIEFIHALWDGRRETAMAMLRTRPGFWHSLCLSLTRRLQSAMDPDTDPQVLGKEIKSCAHIMKLLALELYTNQGSKLDKNLKTVLLELLSKERLQYWSEYLRESLEWSSELKTPLTLVSLSEHSTLHLLKAWRNLLLVLSALPDKDLDITIHRNVKEQLLKDLLTGIQCQFVPERDVTSLNVKLASVTSVFFLSILKQWVKDVECWSDLVSQLEVILTQTCACCEALLPSVQIGLQGALTLILQRMRQNLRKDSDQRCLHSLVPVVCGIVQQSTYRLPAPQAPVPTPSAPPHTDAHTQQSESVLRNGLTRGDARAADAAVAERSRGTREGGQSSADYDVLLKMQTSSISLLAELVYGLDTVESWLPQLRQHSILENLITSIETWTQMQQGLEYVESVILLCLAVAQHPRSAEYLSSNGLAQQLCLMFHSVYAAPRQEVLPSGGGQPPSGASSGDWLAVYRLSVSLFSALLDVLKYNFLQNALDFVGVHQDRFHQCLGSVGVSLHTDVLLEAEATCRFLAVLSHYRKQWRLQLGDVLQKLMMAVCLVAQRSTSLLIRPHLLNHMLERKKQGQDYHSVLSHDKLVTAPLTRRLSQQSSTDDTDAVSGDVLTVQSHLLNIVCPCLVALRQFSPDLCEIVLDQSLDVGEYETFLEIGFSTPSVDQDSPPTFGTLVSCVTMCLILLNKVDHKGTSPAKNRDSDSAPIKRNTVFFVLENALCLILSQALLYLRNPHLSSREKQLLKRELSAELNSFLLSMQRYLRRGPSSPAPGAASSSSSASLAGAAAAGSGTSPRASLSKGQLQTQTSLAGPEYGFLRLVDGFVRKILR